MIMRGVRFIESPFHTEPLHDFSGCRSPGRAKRRLARGIRGRVITRNVPRRDAISLDGQTFIIHPEFARFARDAMADFAERWSAGKITPKFYVDRLGR